MKFTITPAELTGAVSAALASLPSRPNPAVMGGLRIDADGEKISVAAYSWDHSTTARTGAEIGEPGSALVSGKLLALVCRVLPKSRPATVAVDGAVLAVESDKTRFTLPLMSLDDFPDIPTADQPIGTVDTAELVDAIRTVSRAAQRDGEALSALGCISLVDDGDCITITALDRKRLLTAVVPWDGEHGEIDVRIDADDLLAACKGIESSATVTVCSAPGSTLLTLDGGDRTSTLSTVDLPFPNWERLFPDEYSTSVRIGGEFTESLARVVAMAGDEYFADIAISSDGRATLSIDGTITDEVDVEVHGDDIDFQVNPANLADAHAALGAEPTMRFASSRMAVLDTDDGFDGRRALVMGGNK